MREDQSTKRKDAPRTDIVEAMKKKKTAHERREGTKQAAPQPPGYKKNQAEAPDEKKDAAPQPTLSEAKTAAPQANPKEQPKAEMLQPTRKEENTPPPKKNKAAPKKAPQPAPTEKENPVRLDTGIMTVDLQETYGQECSQLK